MTPEEFQSCVAAAALAPSAHNTQPVRWHRAKEGIEVHCDGSRWLQHGDPSGRDHAIAAGAAVEAFALRAADLGYGITVHEVSEFDTLPDATKTQHVALLTMASGATSDPLARQMEVRQSYRGDFGRATKEDRKRLQDVYVSDPSVHVITDPADIHWLARLGDQASRAAFAAAPLYQELWPWLRFTRTHPDFARDGLNADALLMTPIERFVGPIFASPTFFKFLQRLGLETALLSESSIAQNALAMLLLTPEPQLSWLQTGRWFYRVWLAVTACGLAACPMSTLADHSQSAEKVLARFNIPDELDFINVLRVGRPVGSAHRRARLPLDELIIS